MKTIEEIRIENLNKLIVESGGPTKFSARIVKTQNQVSQLAHGHKGIGSKVARSIEQMLDLERGWMDHDHSLDISLLSIPAILHAAQAMAVMEPEARYLAVRLIDQVPQPAPSENGPKATPEQYDPNNHRIRAGK